MEKIIENKNVVTLRHHPMNVKFTNTFYTSQVPDNLNDYIIIDATSRIERNKDFMKDHPNFAHEVSPFYIGPIISSDGVKCNIFENLWQCSKVYPCHDDHGKPNKNYFDWRNKHFAMTNCTKKELRHPHIELGYEARDCRYVAYYDDNLKDYVNLDWVGARKKIYIKEYAKLVYNTDSFKYIKSLVDSGKKVALLDFDTYNYYYDEAMKQKYKQYINNCKKNNVTPSLKESDFVNIDDIKKVVNCKFLSAGHGFVLKMMLDGIITVSKDGIVNDIYGILN